MKKSSFLIAGKHAVTEALKNPNRKVLNVFLTEDSKKKLNKESRLYNKNLGGGAILDLGCYPVSFSTLIASLISKIDYSKVRVLNKKKTIAHSGGRNTRLFC